MEFGQNFYMHLHLQDLGWDRYLSFFYKFVTELWPLIDVFTA